MPFSISKTRCRYSPNLTRVQHEHAVASPKSRSGYQIREKKLQKCTRLSKTLTLFHSTRKALWVPPRRYRGASWLLPNDGRKCPGVPAIKFRDGSSEIDTSNFRCVRGQFSGLYAAVSSDLCRKRNLFCMDLSLSRGKSIPSKHEPSHGPKKGARRASGRVPAQPSR